LDQLTWRGGTQQADGQALQIRRSCSSNVALTDTGKELIGAKGQGSGYVNFVDQDYKRRTVRRDADFLQRIEEPLHRTDFAMGLPKRREL
jgi:hypothetical protein